jgi:hypothetical protein
MDEATVEATPDGRYVVSEGWFVPNVVEALAVKREEKGGRRRHSDRGPGRSRSLRRVSLKG